MKKTNKIIFLIFILLTQSCSHFKGSRHISSENSSEKYLDIKHRDEIKMIESLIEKSLVWRESSIQYYNSNYQKFSKKEHLSHQEMENIIKWGKDYLEIRNQLLAITKNYKLGIGDDTTASLTPSKGTKIEENNFYDSNDTTQQQKIRKNYFINPSDEQGQELLYRLKIALVTATVLYDNYMIGIYPYDKNWKIRRLVNKDSEELKNQLEKVTDSFFNYKNRIEYFKSAKFYEEVYSYQTEKDLKLFEDEKYFDTFVTQSPIFQFMIKGKNISDIKDSFKSFTDKFLDRAKFLKETSSHYLSMVFGNSMGLFASRKGKLKSLSATEKNQIISKLKPLDILLEKTPFRLTDKFIPGHYGHVAIWIGSENELKELGIWDHPFIKKHQEEIRNGHQIIEALRPGVEINTLDHFLNIDDFLVLRHENLSINEKIEFTERAFKQIGKEYDFNFDVETDNRIVCSEIVYVVFHNIDWPTERTLGRYTISPDNVAAKAVDNGPLQPVLMYQDGIKIEDQNMYSLLESNLREK